MENHPVTTLRALGTRVYLPTFFFFVGEGAILPIIALAARDLGASAAAAAFVVALRSLGILIFDIPAGWIIARFGERTAVAIGSACFIVTLTGWIFTSSIV